MLKQTKARTVQQFFTTEFSRATPAVVKQIAEKAQISANAKPAELMHQQVDAIFRAIKQVKIMAPPTDCLSPIGEAILVDALKNGIHADFFASTTRSPAVYRGIPFQVEAAIAYGGDLPQEDFIELIRFANKVPLQHQKSACAMTKAVIGTSWKNYGLQQSKSALPTGPVVLVVHIASVWVPFTSESKEAIAHYPEIMREVKLALQEVGRKLGMYMRKTVRMNEQRERASLFEAYIPELASSLASITKEGKTEIMQHLQKRLKKDLPLLMGEKKDD